MKMATTTIESATHSHTSVTVKVSIEVEPNKVLHTSPDRFDEGLKMFMIRYPKASAETDIIAIAASPLIFAFCPVRRSSIALIIVTGRTRSIWFVRLQTEAIAIAPKATWDKPSPMNENLLSTSVTPSNDEHSAISTPTMSAYLTKGNCRYIISVSIVFPPRTLSTLPWCRRICSLRREVCVTRSAVPPRYHVRS